MRMCERRHLPRPQCGQSASATVLERDDDGIGWRLVPPQGLRGGPVLQVLARSSKR